MSCEQILSGTIILGDELESIEGYICVEDGFITEIGEESTTSKNIIAPCFVNSHTHIGDSICKDPILGTCENFRVKKDLDSLVRPPDGLKHRMLEKTSYSDLVNSMRSSMEDMLATGTCAFADFREGGVLGILALEEAVDGIIIDSIILGRPKDTDSSMDSVLSDINRVLRHADGLGMSGTNDVDMELLRRSRKASKNKSKMFAIHAGEKSDNDIDKALSLDPDILIHMTQAKTSDLMAVADANIPVVVCPRSNFITDVGMAPISEMLESGVTVAVGTDNVMLNSVNMFSEMEILSKVFGLEDRQVFKMCTLNGASILGFNNTGSIKEGNKANLMILNGTSNNLIGVKDPVSGIVRRGRPDDILSIIHANE
ncbi:Cytosine/adenosine deaminase [Methanococcoides vulcani]|uniref:Cytosine/adenosine deaminase n=1 Tax=Methanococcoides vulcani TaxID=1353158 RepID=A0A1I0BAU8_9EURY|nr:amidohydrolase family protein [Methanococcoides vulcani]SET03925.1 Cytosine/adenosine deaminase [Methanococcoides vulcani]